MDPLTKATLIKLIMFFSTTPVADFPTFLDKIPSEIKATEVAAAIDTYQSDPQKLKPEQWNIMFRLAGVYARTKYQPEMQASLKSLVALDTSFQGPPPTSPPRPQKNENPNIRKIGKLIQQLAKRCKLEFTNYDDFMFEVTLKANRPLADPPAFGLLTHSDVVPVNASDWLGAKDKPPKTPFEMRVLSITEIPHAPKKPDVQVLLGRGTEDDKCSIVSAIYAMRVAKETKMPLRRSIRLLIETTEESSGDGIQHLINLKKDPQYNVVLDANYPVVSAESGVGNLTVNFKLQPATGEGAEITSILGASASNQIAQTAYFALKYPPGTDLDQAKKVLQARADAFAARPENIQKSKNSHNPDKKITFTVEAWKNDQLKVTVSGLSAHSSEPTSGWNPVPRAMLLINELRVADDFSLKENHFTDAAKFVAEMIGVDVLGQKFGIAYQDFAGNPGMEKFLPDMGPLFMSLTQVGIPGDNQLRPTMGKPVGEEAKLGKTVLVVCNLRNPRGNLTPAMRDKLTPKVWAKKSAAQLVKDIAKQMNTYDPKLKFSFAAKPEERKALEWLWVDSNSPWINTLISIFNGVYNEPGTHNAAVATAGTTTAKKLKKAVSFGPSLGDVAVPEQKYRGHTVNEFKRLENFLLDVQLYTEMVLQIANLERLE